MPAMGSANFSTGTEFKYIAVPGATVNPNYLLYGTTSSSNILFGSWAFWSNLGLYGVKLCHSQHRIRHWLANLKRSKSGWRRPGRIETAPDGVRFSPTIGQSHILMRM